MIKIPILEGLIDRRLLINFAVDKEVLQKFLPTPFRPKLIGDKGMAGICLIRLKHIRPNGFPYFIGLDSENAAHRIAIEWTEDGELKEGVYIPRRDTNSTFNHLVGGRLFPGVHYKAQFNVEETENYYSINVKSEDNNIIEVNAVAAKDISSASILKNIETASNFFKNGSIGFSPNKKNYDGMMLQSLNWKISPLSIARVKSSFFENENIFPKGSVTFDSALLMRNIKHKWVSYEKQPDIIAESVLSIL